MSVTVSAFYKFVDVAEPERLRSAVETRCRAAGICGTVIVAPEGINGTISGSAESLAHLFDWLRCDPRFATLETKESTAGDHPFRRLKVKLKPEIVTLGEPSANPATEVGTYVTAADWNRLITSPGVVLIDTRNSYEVDVGTFVGAIDPETRTFGEFPAWVQSHLDPVRDTKIAMFCTGGIRCEKATALLLSLGFPEVYHLQGGILKYLETERPETSLWRGECFVFDERVSVGHGLVPGCLGRCQRCGQPVSRTSDKACAVCASCSG